MAPTSISVKSFKQCDMYLYTVYENEYFCTKIIEISDKGYGGRSGKVGKMYNRDKIDIIV